MKRTLALYRSNTGVHVSMWNEPKDAWLHNDEVRISEAIEVDFPDRPQSEIASDVEGIRTRAMERIRRLAGEAA